jgi:hypothetical protein
MRRSLASMWRSLASMWRSLASMWRSPWRPGGRCGPGSPARRSFRASWPGFAWWIRAWWWIRCTGMHQILHGARIHHNLFPGRRTTGPAGALTSHGDRAGPRGAAPGGLPRAGPPRGQGCRRAAPCRPRSRGISTPTREGQLLAAQPYPLGHRAHPRAIGRTHGPQGRPRPPRWSAGSSETQRNLRTWTSAIQFSVAFPSPTVHRSSGNSAAVPNECEHELRCGVSPVSVLG